MNGFGSASQSEVENPLHSKMESVEPEVLRGKISQAQIVMGIAIVIVGLMAFLAAFSFI